MTLRVKKKIFILIILFFSLFIIDFLSCTVVNILSKKGIFYNKNIITQDYNDYLKVSDPILGWKNSDSDHYGARVDKSIFSEYKTCIDMYGDSFTYALEVEEVDAWPSILSEKLRCRVRNYGVVGYGTDQAYLRYKKQSFDYSKIVVLNHLSEDILRNINQFHNLLYPNTKLALKPRFIINNNELYLIKTIILSQSDFKRFLVSPQIFLEYDYFSPSGESGVQLASFPYTISLLKALKHYHVMAIFNKKSRTEDFYQKKHKSQALHITETIMRDFDKSAREKGLIPILTIIPTCRDFQHKNIHGQFPYKNLADKLNKDGFFFIDFGLEIINSRSNFKDLYYNCSSHMNKIGNQALAKIFERKLKEMQLY